MKKYTIIIIFIVCMFIALFGCNKKNPASSGDPNPEDTPPIIIPANPAGIKIFGTQKDRGFAAMAKSDNSIMLAGATKDYSLAWNGAMANYSVNADGSLNTRNTTGYSGYYTNISASGGGGFIIPGYTKVNGSDEFSSAFLVKTDAAGNTLVFSSAASAAFMDAKEATDGYILAGLSPDSVWPKLYIYKTDSAGVFSWSKSVNVAALASRGAAVEVVADGYVFAGSCGVTEILMVNKFTPTAAFLYKTDFSGNKTWEYTYGNASSSATSMIKTSDNYFVLCGQQNGSGYLLKTDSDGIKVWDKVFASRSNSVCESPGGGYVVFGNTNMVGGDAIEVTKFDTSGTQLWKKMFGVSATASMTAGTIRPMPDGNLLLSGTVTYMGMNLFNAYLIKLDTSGNKVW